MSQAGGGHIRIVGHRGARNLWPENSLGGFRRAAALGIDAVELDLHLSGDGEVVVIHDPLLERTTDGRGPVAAFDLASLRRLRLRDSIAETVPTLGEVLDIYRPTAIALELELKMDAIGNPYPDMIEKTIALVRARGMTDRVRLTCFVPEVLEEMRRVASHIPRLASLDRRSAEVLGGLDRAIRRFLDLDCVVAVERSLLDLEFDRCLRAIGTERLGVWVPNTPPELAFWLRKPVGYLTSDRPDLALALRAAIASRTVEKEGW